ncbi:MAG: hypothetical protein HQL51_15285 [Magnetococcales bacterium]|nr:hypothetical protein [Magnetococcales bacterium]
MISLLRSGSGSAYVLVCIFLWTESPWVFTAVGDFFGLGGEGNYGKVLTIFCSWMAIVAIGLQDIALAWHRRRSSDRAGISNESHPNMEWFPLRKVVLAHIFNFGLYMVFGSYALMNIMPGEFLKVASTGSSTAFVIVSLMNYGLVYGIFYYVFTILQGIVSGRLVAQFRNAVSGINSNE